MQECEMAVKMEEVQESQIKFKHWRELKSSKFKWISPKLFAEV